MRRGDVQLAGTESASTPLLTAFVLEADRCGHPVNAFSIRKEAKKYGLKNWIEGAPTDQPVILVDDLVSQIHYTMLHAMRVLDAHEIPLSGHIYAAVYKTHTPDVPIERGSKKYMVNHVFSLKDFDLMFEDYERTKEPAHAASQR